MKDRIRIRLETGNNNYIDTVDKAKLEDTAQNGQHPYAIVACCLNVEHAVSRLRKEFDEHPEIGGACIEGAVYDIRTGRVSWL